MGKDGISPINRDSIKETGLNRSNPCRGLGIWPKQNSNDSLTKKASLNVLASVIDYCARLLVGFVIAPLLVSGLGEYFFGAWQIIGRAVGYLTPASGRANQSLKLMLAHQQASKNFGEKKRYVGSAIVVWLFFLPMLMVFGVVLSWFIPIFLDSPDSYVWPIRYAAWLLVAGLIVTSLAEIPRSILQGENLGYKRMGVSAFFVFIGGGFTWFALYMGTGLIGVSAATLLANLLTGFFFFIVVKKHVKWFGIARPTKDRLRSFLSLSGWLIAWNLCNRVIMASDVILLGVFCSVELVSSYTLTKYLPEIMITFIAMAVFSISPGIGRVIGSGDLNKAAALRGEMMSLTWLTFTAVGCTVLVWDWAFVRLWVGAQHFAGPMSVFLIVIVVIQFLLIRNDSVIIDLTLSLPHKVIIGAISAILSVVAAGVLMSRYQLGIMGLCTGLIFGRTILSIGYPILVGRLLNISFSHQLKGILRPAITSILLLFFAFKTGNFVNASNDQMSSQWLELIFWAGITFGVFFLLAFFCGLSINQRLQIINRFYTVTTMLTLRLDR